MSWEYRVMKSEFGYGIHEVYYNKKGKIEMHSEDAMEPYGNNLKELKESVANMHKAFSKPTLTWDTKKGYTDVKD